MPRIYTRTGDGGDTSLIGGSRTRKSDARVDLYGEVDELNCALGLAVAFLNSTADALPEQTARATMLGDELETLQSALFELGAVLADPERCEALTREAGAVTALDTAWLERGIDRMEEDLSPLTNFILPGGSPAAAALHAARAVSRRLERRAVGVSTEIAVPESILGWLNRLSDWLFVAARRANVAADVADTPWRPQSAD
jgi:cob(I)alamin adenosyltransferase